MLFNSIEFAFFLPIVFLLYWYVFNHNLGIQNLYILVVSYVFYGWWDWRFLFLMCFSTLVDYTVGLCLKRETRATRRKIFLWISIGVNLGFLGFFKYFNFFIESFVDAFHFFGRPLELTTLKIILPVGISFYTFQTLSYSIDVYKKKLEPTTDFVAFGAFVSFFPQLVAGPIERATSLLPQFFRRRTFDYDMAVKGMRQILWGLFKKIVIADNCAKYANEIFNNSEQYSGATLILGAFFFTFQIYGDFSGYSDIAIGTSRLFGFNLKQNFATPYFARDIAEFWRRWHISLTTWFRDYVYIPLGGSRGGKWQKIRNTFVIFLVSGFWHGANWTFIVWGGLNAIYFLPLLLRDKNRKNLDVVAQDRVFPSIKEWFSMTGTFILVMFTWIFFRAESIEHAMNFISKIFIGSIRVSYFPDWRQAVGTLPFIAFMILVEWSARRYPFVMVNLSKVNSRARQLIFIGLVLLIICFGNFGDEEFIYFQF